MAKLVMDQYVIIIPCEPKWNWFGSIAKWLSHVYNVILTIIYLILGQTERLKSTSISCLTPSFNPS